MAKAKMKSPISLILTIVDDGVGERVEEYLLAHKLSNGILFNGKGTAESMVADIFGFGLGNRDVIIVLVPVEKQDKVLEDITKLTGIEEDEYGLSMIIPIDAASSTILDQMGIRL